MKIREYGIIVVLCATILYLIYGIMEKAEVARQEANQRAAYIDLIERTCAPTEDIGVDPVTSTIVFIYVCDGLRDEKP